ncbi:IS481 family transposase [Methylomagnum sp.]
MPVEALLALRQRLADLPPRAPERKILIVDTATTYGVSPATVYRALRHFHRPRAVGRSDRGQSRRLPTADMERYCELVAALKVRTTHRQGRHLSTARALELLERYGVETPQGLVQAPPGLLTRATVDRYLRHWGLDLPRLTRAPPAVRFEAEHSNDAWQFDLSPSDLKQVEAPLWFEPGRGRPTLMLFGVADDRSGVCYQEYRCVYGEEVEAALRFLFNAMAPKDDPDFPFQGRPKMLYVDNGPVTKSRVFQRVMDQLGIAWQAHRPAGEAKRHATARAKGKVERPFRTVKEAHETLYHFHRPRDEAEANLWLRRYLLNYNRQSHRREPHSRLEDWLAHLPPEGLREMCSFERFCTFAREPERRKVGVDARISVGGTLYEVDPDLAGESVVLWWGLFDTELYVEHRDQRFGPYAPVAGPIPLHRYRAFKKGPAEERADKIEQLAARLGLPRAALTGEADVRLAPVDGAPELKRRPFPPMPEDRYASVIAAKLAIADELARPLAKLSQEERRFIDQVLGETLVRAEVLQRIRDHFRATPHSQGGHDHAG